MKTKYKLAELAFLFVFVGTLAITIFAGRASASNTDFSDSSSDCYNYSGTQGSCTNAAADITHATYSSYHFTITVSSAVPNPTGSSSEYAVIIYFTLDGSDPGTANGYIVEWMEMGSTDVYTFAFYSSGGSISNQHSYIDRTYVGVSGSQATISLSSGWVTINSGNLKFWVYTVYIGDTSNIQSTSCIDYAPNTYAPGGGGGSGNGDGGDTGGSLPATTAGMIGGIAGGAGAFGIALVTGLLAFVKPVSPSSSSSSVSQQNQVTQRKQELRQKKSEMKQQAKQQRQEMQQKANENMNKATQQNQQLQQNMQSNLNQVSFQLGSVSRAQISNFKSLLMFSDKIKISQIAQAFNIPDVSIQNKVLEWGPKYGFTLEGDVVRFDTGNKDKFLNVLDNMGDETDFSNF